MKTRNKTEPQNKPYITPPPLRASPDAQTKQNPKSPGGWWSGGGTDVVQGAKVGLEHGAMAEQAAQKAMAEQEAMSERALAMPA